MTDIVPLKSETLVGLLAMLQAERERGDRLLDLVIGYREMLRGNHDIMKSAAEVLRANQPRP